MKKTKLFVTASAISLALVGATLSELPSQSPPPVYYAGHTSTGHCVQGTAPNEEDCSRFNQGAQCTIFVVDPWGTPEQAPAYQSPSKNNLCLWALKTYIP